MKSLIERNKISPIANIKPFYTCSFSRKIYVSKCFSYSDECVRFSFLLSFNDCLCQDYVIIYILKKKDHIFAANHIKKTTNCMSIVNHRMYIFRNNSFSL